MTFVNASLLLGGLLLAIPVVLHLLMRRQPKRQVFPPLQFLKRRLHTNQRTLQVRHWWLLFLRGLLIVLLALALARPSVAAQDLGNWLVIGLFTLVMVLVSALCGAAWWRQLSRWLVVVLGVVAAALFVSVAGLVATTLAGTSGALLGNEEAPVAAALIVDSSPRMDYQFQNESRLERAQEIGTWLLGELPSGSQVAVLENRSREAVFAVDVAAAEKTLKRIRTGYAPTTIPTLIDRALQLLESAELPRKEIYIFSDLTEAGWGPSSDLANRLAQAKEVALYVIDVGIKDPQNFGLGQIRLASDIVPGSGELQLETELRNWGPGGERMIELWIEEPDPSRPIIVDGKPLYPEARLRAQERLELAAGGTQSASLRLRGLPQGIQHGYVKLPVADGLAGDNVRYFTVEVQEAWPILVVAPDNVAAHLWIEAVAPSEFARTGLARFRCDRITPGEWQQATLRKYAAVCLLDPTPLTDEQWANLRDYATGGGGVGIFLGANAAADASFQSTTARQLLGGRLERQWRTGERDVFLDPRNYEHPLLAEFRSQATSVPWDRLPVFRHWELVDRPSDQDTVIPYSNGQPALLERDVGRGRVLVWTTPLTEPARPAGRAPWNELLVSEDAWPAVVLVNEMLVYLVRNASSPLNYVTGQSVVLGNDSEQFPERYDLFTPDAQTQEVLARDGQLTVNSTDVPGAYRLKGNREGIVLRGFSANYPDSATDLQRLSREQLDQILGDERYQLARNQDEMVREVGQARLGAEFAPYLLVILALVLGLETLLANRFYRDESPASPASNLRQVA